MCMISVHYIFLENKKKEKNVHYIFLENKKKNVHIIETRVDNLYLWHILYI